MIILSNICKTYEGKGVTTFALTNINLSIKQGEFIIIYGKSGCGKSTLLNILGTMDRPAKGDYLFNDTDICKMKFNELAQFRNNYIGFVFQSFYLINEFSALDNVEMPLGYAGVGKVKRCEMARDLLRTVGLWDKMKNKPCQLSGGEQQRVAIARALINQPKLLIADEPTGNLDEKTSIDIMNLLREINKSGTTMVIVTHNMDLLQYASRVICMTDGVISPKTV